jgi:prophage regulatory protein
MKNSLETERLIRKNEVCRLAGGIDQSTLWKWVKSGQFPQPVVLNPRSRFVAWKLSEVLQWIEQRQHSFLAPPIAANAARRRQRRGFRVRLLPKELRGKVQS